jgi:hypothetical protein
LLSAAEFDGLIKTVQDQKPTPTLLQRADGIGKLARKLAKRFNIGRKRKIDYWLDRCWDF